MKLLFNRILKDDQGVLTFEWILLLALLVIGIVGGLATVRDALIVQLGSEASAILAVNASYVVKTPIRLYTTVGDSDINDYLSGTAVGSKYEYAGTEFPEAGGINYNSFIASIEAYPGAVPENGVDYP